MEGLYAEFERLGEDLRLEVPSSSSVVHKKECLYSIDNEYSEHGIFVNLATFESFGKDMLKYDRKCERAVYLNVRRFLRPVSDESDPDESSFDDQSVTYKEKKFFEEESEYSVFAPSLGTLKLEEAPPKIQKVCKAVIDHVGYDFKAQSLSWTSQIETSKYAYGLFQVENPPQISHENLKCQNCGAKTNLWLNLSDGFIGCGRRFYDGGGCEDGSEGAALTHYQETGEKFHLVVKLGTITATSADVYSYAKDEDNLVLDPLLDRHLAHFGIKIQLLEKTEKTTLQLELEKNQSHNWTDVVSTNPNDAVVKMFPRFVGLLNLGNNCYINSVVQFLNNVEELNRYFLDYYQDFNVADFNDILLQYSKICTCINTERFIGQCKANLEAYKRRCKQMGLEYHDVTGHDSFSVNPNMFKHSLSKCNRLFENNDQQDAEEFLSFFVDYLAQNLKPSSRMGGDLDLKSLFYFNAYQMVKCDDLKTVDVNRTETHLLSLSLLNSLNTALGDSEEVDLTKEIALTECLENWANGSEVDYIRDGVTYRARLKNGLKRLPKYLIVKLERFYIKRDWSYSKLINPVLIPEVLVLTPFNENMDLPGYTTTYNQGGDSGDKFEVDEGLLQALMSMGFTEYQVRRSYFANRTADVDQCLNWILSNDVSEPTEALVLLNELGHTDNKQNMKLLGYFGDDVSALLDHLASSSDAKNEPGPEVEEGGEERYELVGLITHVGNNLNSGHYICHLKKDGKWYAFNDSKINTCADPPLQNGYLYLFKAL